jgi:hypothetical protein
MEQQSYRTKIDLRVLSEKLRFIFYVSGGKRPKQRCLELTYNTNQPVESVYRIDKNGGERMFLIFKYRDLKIHTHMSLLYLNESDLIVEVFKNSSGSFGFNQMSGNGYGAFLSHPQYFNPGTSGALTKFGELKGRKSHAIQMILSNCRLRKSSITNPTFDMDILSEKCNQYTHTLIFKPNVDNDVVIEGDTLDIKPVKQIITENREVELQTTYISLGQKELASREVIFDYNKELKKQNFNWENLTLTSSEVYSIKNTIKPLTNLIDFNLPPTNVIEIPYNISREYYNEKVIPSTPINRDGKQIYPLNWIKELQNNDIIKHSKKCISFEFSSREQLIAFSEKLKEQQIGNIETYPVESDFETTTTTKRTYSRISQWIERSTLDKFTDARFSYDADGYISNILICPAKNSQIGPTKISTENNLYTSGGEYILPGGENYVGYYHVHSEKGPMVGKTHTSEPHSSLIPLFTYAPISGFSSTDFCFSTYDIKNKIGTYTGFTYTTKRDGTINPTYDIHLSGSSFSGRTSIPITNIERSKKLPLISDESKMYTSYAFPQVYDGNGGSVKLNNSDPVNYFEYTAKTTGVYRFTYEAYLNIKYSDTKWCDYLKVNYPSGSTGNYPSSDYDIKRLINTSIIREGEGERDVVLLDTNLRYHPGVKYCGSGAERKYCPKEGFTNTGINEFNFIAQIIKTTSAGTGTNLASYSIGRSKLDGGSNEYLTLDVSNMDKYASGFTTCVLSTASGSTIFSKQIPIKVDTGLITLNKGEKVVLRYNTNWTTTSKRGGTTNIDINLGHKLGSSGQTIESPYYRGVKLSSVSKIISKKLFFDPSKHSLPFKMVQGTMSYTTTMDGTLYISDTDCGNILRPTVNKNTFGKLNFVDTTAPQNRLVWDIDQNTPTNQWQGLIESNQIKDYTLEIGDKKSLTHLKDNGAFCFYLPTYNDEFGATCNYTFPSVSQSYVVHNQFKNIGGNNLEHFIVVTPQCKFYKPCTATKPKTVYDILHKSLPERRKLINYNQKLTINGKEVVIVSNKSHSNPEPTRLPQQSICKFYCSCGQPATSALDSLPGWMMGGSTTVPIDSIFGTTNIITDLDAGNCEECLQNATNYCSNLMGQLPGWMAGGTTTPQCEPFIVGDCELSNPSPSQTNLIRKKGQRIIVTVTENNQVISSGPEPDPRGPTGGQPGMEDEYGCKEGEIWNPETLSCEEMIRDPRGGGPNYGDPRGGGPLGRPTSTGGVIPLGGKPLGPTGPKSTIGGYYCEGASYGCQYTTNTNLIVFTTIQDCRAFCVGTSSTNGDDGPKDPRGGGDEPVKPINEVIGVSEEELEEIREKEPEKYDDIIKEVSSDELKYAERPSEKNFCQDGYYWCESAGKCISLKEACK